MEHNTKIPGYPHPSPQYPSNPPPQYTPNPIPLQPMQPPVIAQQPGKSISLQFTNVSISNLIISFFFIVQSSCRTLISKSSSWTGANDDRLFKLSSKCTDSPGVRSNDENTLCRTYLLYFWVGNIFLSKFN